MSHGFPLSPLHPPGPAALQLQQGRAEFDLRWRPVVGAHYDSPPHSLGADENASGVIALLEIDHRWSIDQPQRPVWIVAFDQKEWGMVGRDSLAAPDSPGVVLQCLGLSNE